MNKKIYFIFILFFIFSLFKLSSAQAIQNGEDATGDELISSVRGFDSYLPGQPGCSASLIHPRIAITAAHCHVFARYISTPGQDRSLPGQVEVVQAFTPSAYVHPCSSQDWTCRSSDFGLLVLKKPFPSFNKAVRMATIDEIKEWMQAKTPGVVYGFGLTSSDSGPQPRPSKSTWYPVRIQNNTVMVETKVPNVVTCPGDSGGPLYFRKGSEILYVGPHFTKSHDKSGDSSVTRPCGLFADGTSPWSTHTIMALYPDLMQQALAKVAELETAEAKMKEKEIQVTKAKAAKKQQK